MRSSPMLLGVLSMFSLGTGCADAHLVSPFADGGSLAMLADAGTYASCGDGVIDPGELCLASTPTSTTPFPTESIGEGMLYAADMDGDGALDIVVDTVLAPTDPPTTALYVYFNDGHGVLEPPRNLGEIVDHGFGVIFPDLDGDGAGDVVVPVARDHTLLWGLTVGRVDHGITGAIQVALAPALIETPAYGDLDGDGDLDVVAPMPEVAGIAVFLNDGMGTLAYTTTIPTDPDPISVAVAQLDGTGPLDLAVGYQDSSTRMAMLFGLGALAYGRGESLVLDMPDLALVNLGDVDRDGTLDIGYAAIPQGDMQVVLHRGGLVAGPRTTIGGRPLALRDVNADGSVDVLSQSTRGQGVQIRLDDGEGQFGEPVWSRNGGTFSVVAVDMNGDGALDLVNDAYVGGMERVEVTLATP